MGTKPYRCWEKPIIIVWCQNISSIKTRSQKESQNQLSCQTPLTQKMEGSKGTPKMCYGN